MTTNKHGQRPSMDNDEALILLAASLRNQIDTLERFIKYIERHREAETLRAENAELRRKVQELGGASE